MTRRTLVHALCVVSFFVVHENRVVLPVTLRFDAGKFRLSYRNQFERRYRNTGVKTNHDRTVSWSSIRSVLTDTKLSLFVAEELFYDWAVDRWVRNRFSIGASKVFNKHFTQEFYYLRQNDGVSLPGDLSVIGISLRFKL